MVLYILYQGINETPCVPIAREASKQVSDDDKWNSRRGRAGCSQEMVVEKMEGV